eukprot:6491053-Amphidinium_carterae.1
MPAPRSDATPVPMDQDDQHSSQVTGQGTSGSMSAGAIEAPPPLSAAVPGQARAQGTSLSNKISGQRQGDEPIGKRVRIALSPERRIIPDDAADEDPSQNVQVTEPVTAPVTVPVPMAVPEVTPPPPIPSDHDRTPSQAGSRDHDGGPLRYMCPLCDWRFHSPVRRYLHLGLQHSVILPKIGGVSQDNPSSEGLYMIPVLSAVRGHNGCTLWANEKIKSAYQSVVRNALTLPRSEWHRVSSMRWGSRDDEKFVPPKNVPPSHMDMPDENQIAEFYSAMPLRSQQLV